MYFSLVRGWVSPLADTTKILDFTLSSTVQAHNVGHLVDWGAISLTGSQFSVCSREPSTRTLNLVRFHRTFYVMHHVEASFLLGMSGTF